MPRATSEFGPSLSGEEEVALATILFSALFEAIYRASVPAIAELRRAFVAVLASSVGLVPITAEIAEAHASLRADLCRKVDLVGVNDLIIAATAAHF